MISLQISPEAIPGSTSGVSADSRKCAEEELRDWNRVPEACIADRTAAIFNEETGKKEASEQTLRQQTLLLQLSHDAILVRSFVDGRIRFWNRRATEIYGFTEQQALGKSVHELLNVKYPEPLKDIEEKVFRLGRWDGELIYTRNDGTELILDSRWSIMRDEENNSADILELNLDITEKKRAEQRLMESERVTALDTATAVFAHEMANPLASISFSVEFLEAQLKQDEVSPDLYLLLETLGDEIRRLNTLLNEFRSFARPRVLNRKPCQLAEILNSVLIPAMAAYRSAGIIVKRDFDNGLPLILLDEDKIKQVILNLCKNAVEAMPHGGALTVRSYRAADNAIIEITDTGGGIPPGIDVFQLFTTTKTTGSGLGLPVVRQIVAAHRGHIEYASEPGDGTTFKVSLPYRD